MKASAIFEIGSLQCAILAVNLALRDIALAIEALLTNVDCVALQQSLSEVSDDETPVFSVQFAQAVGLAALRSQNRYFRQFTLVVFPVSVVLDFEIMPARLHFLLEAICLQSNILFSPKILMILGSSSGRECWR